MVGWPVPCITIVEILKGGNVNFAFVNYQESTNYSALLYSVITANGAVFGFFFLN